MKKRWNYQDKSNLISHRNLLKLCHLLIFANISDLRAKQALLMPSTCKINILYLSPTPHNYFRLSVMWSSVKTCSSWYLMNNWRKRWEYLKSDSIEVRFTIETPGGATEVVLGHKHLCLVSISLDLVWVECICIKPSSLLPDETKVISAGWWQPCFPLFSWKAEDWCLCSKHINI